MAATLMAATLIRGVEAAVSKEHLKTLYLCAQREVHQQVEQHLQSMVDQIKKARHDLIEAQATLVDEVALQRVSQWDAKVAMERQCASEIAIAVSVATGAVVTKMGISIAASEAAASVSSAGALGSREELEAVLRSKELLLLSLEHELRAAHQNESWCAASTLKSTHAVVQKEATGLATQVTALQTHITAQQAHMTGLETQVTVSVGAASQEEATHAALVAKEKAHLCESEEEQALIQGEDMRQKQKQMQQLVVAKGVETDLKELQAVHALLQTNYAVLQTNYDALQTKHDALQSKRDALAQHKGSLQAQMMGVNQENLDLHDKLDVLNKELGQLGVGKAEAERERDASNTRLESLVQGASADASSRQLGRLAMIGVAHACQCLHKALEHLTETQAPASILASLSLALVALQDVAAPSREMVAFDALASMRALSLSVTSPLPKKLGSEVKEAVYTVALCSTLSAGRKDVASVGGVGGTLGRLLEIRLEDLYLESAMPGEQGGSRQEGEIKETGHVRRWAALALGCLLMVHDVREEVLLLDKAASVIAALTPLLEGGDTNAQSFACLALGNLAVEQEARATMTMIAHQGATRGLCRSLSTPNLLTQRYLPIPIPMFPPPSSFSSLSFPLPLIKERDGQRKGWSMKGIMRIDS